MYVVSSLSWKSVRVSNDSGLQEERQARFVSMSGTALSGRKPVSGSFSVFCEPNLNLCAYKLPELGLSAVCRPKRIIRAKVYIGLARFNNQLFQTGKLQKLGGE
jgi:hypothetical protein